MRRTVFDNLVGLAMMAIVVLAVVSVGFMMYGHLFKHETINVLIIDKYEKRVQTCSTPTSGQWVTNCRWDTYYKVSTKSGETFGTSQSNYRLIKVGKRHHLEVSGWPGAGRWIKRVIE